MNNINIQSDIKYILTVEICPINNKYPIVDPVTGQINFPYDLIIDEKDYYYM